MEKSIETIAEGVLEVVRLAIIDAYNRGYEKGEAHALGDYD